MEVHELKEMIAQVKVEAIQMRRYLHQHPELSFQEYNTAKYIKSVLTSYGVEFEEVAETGVIVTIKGGKKANDAVVVLRADIDALPIREKNNSDFDSNYEGVMHACGHDFHTANLLSVLGILQKKVENFSGTVLAIFQPAEEKIPGGARLVIDSGVLNRYAYRIKGIVGLHVSPKFKTGQLAVCEGKFMASSDELFIRIKGRGGHGAQPHLNIDPVVIASQLVLSLQQIVSRFANPATPSVLSIGKFIAEGATNVIPNEVYMEGTFRTMDELWREEALLLIEKQIRELPRIYGADVELEVRRGYPVLNNDVQLAQQMKQYLNEFLQEASVLEAPIWMAAEDFAYYTHLYPSVFYLVGIANTEKGISAELHTPNFQIDEDAFDHAIGGMLYAALRLLEEEV